MSHNNVNFRRGDGRMSPNALERRLRAELNLFDSVGDSLQQITEMDRIRDIVQAQQETVSLAQILKNRQALHQKDLDRMSICLLYTSPSPRDQRGSRMPSSA